MVKVKISNTTKENLLRSEALSFTRYLNKLVNRLIEIKLMKIEDEDAYFKNIDLQNEEINTGKSIINVIEKLTGKEYNLNFMDFMFHCSVRDNDYDTIQKVINECFDGIEREDLKSFHYEGDTRIEEMSEYDPFFNYYLNQANKEISKHEEY